MENQDVDDFPDIVDKIVNLRTQSKLLIEDINEKLLKLQHQLPREGEVPQ